MFFGALQYQTLLLHPGPLLAWPFIKEILTKQKILTQKVFNILKIVTMLEIPKTILQQHSASPGRVFCVVRPTGARKLFV